jgi:hypothetical protein
VPETLPEGLQLAQAIETFEANKQAQGVKPRVLAMTNASWGGSAISPKPEG